MEQATRRELRPRGRAGRVSGAGEQVPAGGNLEAWGAAASRP